MNDGFRQRLVGAVVLACVALILWPVIFSDVSNPIVDRATQIPPQPAFQKYTVSQPVRVKDIEPVIARSTALQLEEKAMQEEAREETAVTIAADKPLLDKRGLPKSWVLQVASFSKQSNADELKLALQKKGLKSYIRKVATKDGQSTRVFVGPKLTKSALTADRGMIENTYKLKAIIVPFEP